MVALWSTLKQRKLNRRLVIGAVFNRMSITMSFIYALIVQPKFKSL